MWNWFSKAPDQRPVSAPSQTPLVLAKLGHDLGDKYGEVLRDPLPEELKASVSRLPGGTDVNPEPPEPREAPLMSPRELVQTLSVAHPLDAAPTGVRQE
jgi:hypothetical protein